MHIIVGTRQSPLALVQVDEVFEEIKRHYPTIKFSITSTTTVGDRDQKTSLRSLERTDFFTRDIDTMLLEGGCRIAIHSAKDLPEPIPRGLQVIAITQGVDPSDVLVIPQNYTIQTLPKDSRIATSSVRREEAVSLLRNDFQFVDIRGTIQQRLDKLLHNEVEGVVIAKAALIRLKLKVNEVPLPGETVPLQGQLAVVARDDDFEMREVFKAIDVRK